MPLAAQDLLGVAGRVSASTPPKTDEEDFVRPCFCPLKVGPQGLAHNRGNRLVEPVSFSVQNRRKVLW